MIDAGKPMQYPLTEYQVLFKKYEELVEWGILNKGEGTRCLGLSQS